MITRNVNVSFYILKTVIRLSKKGFCFATVLLLLWMVLRNELKRQHANFFPSLTISQKISEALDSPIIC